MNPILEKFEAAIRLHTFGARARLLSWSYRKGNYSNELKKYKDCQKGRPILIVGNGPSLNSTPLESFSGITSLGMNKINLLFARTTWRPSFILAVNNLVVKQNRDFYGQTEIPLLIAHKAKWFLDSKGRKRAEFFNMFPTEDFQSDFSLGVGRCSTVAYACLQFAYYCGGNPVILVGVDHSFVQQREGVGVYEKAKGPDANHFDPNYFASGTRWATPDYEMDRRNYQRARLAFEADGRRVLDATVGGKLTIFEKIPIEEAVRLARIPGPMTRA